MAVSPHRFALAAAVISMCLAPLPEAWGAGPPRTPNLQGNYVGLFVNPADGSVREANLAPLEQSRHRVSGTLELEDGDLPVNGAIDGAGRCSFSARKGATGMSCRMGWDTFGGGAGALCGEGTFSQAGHRGGARASRTSGTIVFFRPFTAPPAAAAYSRLDVLGAYSGTFRNAAGVEGGLTAQITDGTSNTLRVAIAFSSGGRTTSYLCVGDVAADGAFAAAGSAPDGTVAIVRGYIEQDNLLRGRLALSGNVQLRTAAGRTLDTNSIIAILIG